MSISGIVNDLIERSKFNDTLDFLQAQKSAVVDVGDVRELLQIYERELKGEVRRKKFEKKKVERVEHSLTPSGLKKLSDARKTLRMNIEEGRKRNQRSEELPPIQKDSLTEYYGFDDGPDDFIRKLHDWGKFPIDDRRYYLHMVFRYYFKQYHDHAVSAGTVIPHPSYQYILDTISPNKCANRFPPEFRRFLVDAAGRTIATVSLPVPLKGSASAVTYEYNFEAIPHVSTLRRKIEAIILDWKSRDKTYNVYPPYLRSGNPYNDLVIEAECKARKIDVVKDGLQKIVNVDVASMVAVGDRVPAAFTAYDEYMSHKFKTSGEQLNERMGFFMLSRYRDIFFELDKREVENLFLASGAGMEVLLSFKTFCAPSGKHLGLERDEVLCRALLMVIVDVCFFFDVVHNRSLASGDQRKVLADMLEKVSGG